MNGEDAPQKWVVSSPLGLSVLAPGEWVGVSLAVVPESLRLVVFLGSWFDKITFQNLAYLKHIFIFKILNLISPSPNTDRIFGLLEYLLELNNPIGKGTFLDSDKGLQLTC
jgi:hypothetical protein